MNGILVLDKPAGFTSFDAVAKLRRLFATRKVGHAGTLDPMATGVLPVMLGTATGACAYLTEKTKQYRAEMRFGLRTDTEDVTGRILETSEKVPTLEVLSEAAQRMIGAYEQIPPMYSAIKINGKKLYELAREQIEIERQPRTVTLYDLKILRQTAEDRFELEVTCSKGTYIRTLITDLARSVGCLAVMSALRRLSTGSFSLKEAVTFEQLEAVPEDRRGQLLLPVERAFEALDSLTLSAFYSRLARNGQSVYQKRAGYAPYPVQTLIRMKDETGLFFALGEVVETPEGQAVHPIKQFPPER